MSNPFILIARIRVKEGKVEEYLKIAKEADDAVNASEPDMLIHTFDQDPTDPLEFTWSEVYRNSEAMLHHLNNAPVQAYVEKHNKIADRFEIEVYGNITEETFKAIKDINFLGKQDGLVHISELADKRVAKVTDVVKEGDEVKVKVIGFDRGKVKLSIKQAAI